MWALRNINNNYSDFAGTRSDYVIVGHPEFNLGKAYGNQDAPGFDNGGAKPHPMNRHQFKTTDDQNLHIKRMTNATPKASYKERALTRHRSAPMVGRAAASSPGGLSSSSPSTKAAAAALDMQGQFEAFLATMTSLEELPGYSPSRITSGYANHIGSQPVVRHYQRIQEDLAELRQRLRKHPEATRAELQANKSWKHYAEHLAKARQQEAQTKRTKFRNTAAVQKATMPVLD